MAIEVSMPAKDSLYVEVVCRVLTFTGSTGLVELAMDHVECRQTDFDRQINQYPDDIKEDYLRVCDWVRKLVDLYRHKIVIRIIDAHSLLGIYKALRHRFRKTPTFIVNRRHKYTGWDEGQLEAILDRQLAVMRAGA